MNATPCTPARRVYNGARSLETSHNAEPRPESCGFFAPVPQASCAPVSLKPDGVRRNNQYSEPSLCGFEPPSGTHSCNGLFTPELEETVMNRPDLTSIAVECLCDRLDDLASGLNYLAETAADPGLKILLMDLSVTGDWPAPTSKIQIQFNNSPIAR